VKSESVCIDNKYFSHDPIYIEGNHNFTVSNGVVEGTGTKIDPFIIESWYISNPGGNGIVIRDSDVHFIIRDCKICDCKSGIKFHNVTNGRIDFNEICYNDYGIDFAQGFDFYDGSSYNVISNNSIYFNNYNGIQFEHVGGGYHSFNIIKYNNISNNNVGIYTIMSANNKIIYNNIVSNQNSGVGLDMCMGGGKHNIVHHNNLINNNLDGEKQAYNIDGNNTWNSKSEGNYWNDWIATDNDSNGIVDEPYFVGYSYDSYTDLRNLTDKYPLVSPIEDAGCKPYPNRPPKIIMNVFPINGSVPLNVTFEGNAIDIDGFIQEYIWDFGDGNISTNKNSNHIYSYPGNYSVIFKVIDNDGQETFETITIEVIEVLDFDKDDDGYDDAIDIFPDNPAEWNDTDEDGLGDNEDIDDDNDGYLDMWEIFLKTDSNDFNSTPIDTDNDGKPDGDTNNSQSWMDIDDDNDGMTDDWEKDHKLNSTNPKDSDLDPDEDGATNKEEFDAITDPFYPDEHPDNGNQMDVNEVEEPEETDYTIFIIFGIIIIVILIIIAIFINFKLGKKKLIK
jgi:hypothetical protein